jgi:hypothetical protein
LERVSGLVMGTPTIAHSPSAEQVPACLFAYRLAYVDFEEVRGTHLYMYIGRDRHYTIS